MLAHSGAMPMRLSVEKPWPSSKERRSQQRMDQEKADDEIEAVKKQAKSQMQRHERSVHTHTSSIDSFYDTVFNGKGKCNGIETED